MKIWILTSEYNDYDQHGEYFICAFKDFPSKSILKELVLDSGQPLNLSEEQIENLLSINRGGRIDEEYEWFFLRQVELK